MNTFWACKNHAGNNTLRCAICDEKRIAELEAVIVSLNEIYPKRIAELEAEVDEWKDSCDPGVDRPAKLQGEDDEWWGLLKNNFRSVRQATKEEKDEEVSNNL